MKNRKCNKYGEEKPESEFYQDGEIGKGQIGICKKYYQTLAGRIKGLEFFAEKKED